MHSMEPTKVYVEKKRFKGLYGFVCYCTQPQIEQNTRDKEEKEKWCDNKCLPITSGGHVWLILCSKRHSYSHSL